MVRLDHARIGTFRDSRTRWSGAAEGVVLIDGFDYGSLNDTHVIDVRTRSCCIESVMNDRSPGFSDQPAAAYRRTGREELPARVRIARQHRRCAAAGRATRIWGALPRRTVGDGHRPWLAACAGR
ncbi:hypothetical protein [Pseudonocardia sp.]|uniref:hypothetical protein n=1 Tax=Pseudonocardia sp. TaxID=60912 RepID=UPI002609B2CA|nr:hypothetical protein [Pseudonocardia sp.]